jgi:hypothetical protein
LATILHFHPLLIHHIDRYSGLMQAFTSYANA